MSDEVRRLAFERPPVREVRLAIIFGTLQPFRLTYVAGLYDSWRDQYPDVAERPPLRPFNGSEDDFGLELLTDDGGWPTPYTTLADPRSGRRISFQGDRFAINWLFGDGGASEYPGFENLADELVTRFAEFSGRLASSPAGAVQITHVECTYENYIVDIPSGDYARRMLTGWSGDLPANAVVYEDVVMSQHIHFDESDDGVWVGTSPINDDVHKQGTSLTLRSLRVLTGAQPDLRHELKQCHDLEIKQFLASTSPEMRDSWGEYERT